MRAMSRLVGLLAIVAFFLPAPEAAAEGGLPYVYQRVGDGEGMSATVEYETAYGTRESRFFGGQGVEQGLRMRLQPWPFLNFEAWGGILVRGGRVAGEAASFEVNWRALNQQDHLVDLHLGAGYVYDYRDDHVPRLRAALGRSFGDLDLLLGGLLELPAGSGRDEADIMLGLAGSYRITDWYRQGLELCAEDIEGLWEPQEAEGGAKFLVGPTAYFRLAGHLEIKVNAALVLAYMQNQKAPPGVDLGGKVGFMGRAVLGYSF